MSLQILLEKSFILVVERGAWALPLAVACLAATTVMGRASWPRPRLWRRVGILVCSFLACISAVVFGFEQRFRQSIEQRTAAIRLERLADGSVSTLADYRGRVLVLNFWSTWCPPCRQEMPDLDRLAEAYRDRGIVVVAVSDQDRHLVEEYVALNPLTVEVALFTDGPATPGDPIGALAFQTRPTTLVLDRQGRLHDLLVGAKSFESLAEMVQPLL